MLRTGYCYLDGLEQARYNLMEIVNTSFRLRQVSNLGCTDVGVKKC